MVKKALLNNLVSNQDITSLEKHLLYHYLNNKKLDFTQSPILAEYFRDIEQNAKLFDVSCLEIETVKDLENHLELIIPQTDKN